MLASRNSSADTTVPGMSLWCWPTDVVVPHGSVSSATTVPMNHITALQTLKITVIGEFGSTATCWFLCSEWASPLRVITPCGGPGTWGGGYWTNFLRSVNLLIFQHCQNTGYLLNIIFIFDRCRRSSAAVTPVKYECDANNLTGTFARSKILLTEKLTNRALVTPTPWAVNIAWKAPESLPSLTHWPLGDLAAIFSINF